MGRRKIPVISFVGRSNTGKTTLLEKVIPLLKKSGYDGTITLEVFSPDRRYLLFSREKLKEIWEENS